MKFTSKIYMSEILNDYFEPKPVHDHFIELTKLSHPSGKEDEVRKYVITCAQNIENVEIDYYEPDAKDPGKRVIILHRKGSRNYTNAPYVTLQAHMDMVCFPDEDIFPLHVFGYLDDKGSKWIKAGSEDSIYLPEKGTTLGADNGIGVATILALLKDEKLKDYPLECFLTVQEETDMGGAAGFDKSLLKGNKCINLDAGNVEIIIYGSAGGCTIQYEGEVTLLYIPENFIVLELFISGLAGGHSGANINNGRLNAIKVITETLIRLNKRLTNLDGVMGKGITSYNLRLISINSLTNKEIEEKKIIINKIPNWVHARIAIPSSEKDFFKRDFNAYIQTLKVQFQPEEKNLSCTVEELTSVQNSLNEESTDAVLCLLNQIPHGVIRMIPNSKVFDVVETSSNLAAINFDEVNSSKVVIMSLNRSSNECSMKKLIQIQKIIGEFFSYKVDVSRPYPTWQPKEKCDLLDKAICVCNDIYNIHGIKPKTTVIHAGLECGYIVQTNKHEIDCISIGPTIVNSHTGGERLDTNTVEPFYKAVSSLIQSLFSK